MPDEIRVSRVVQPPASIRPELPSSPTGPSQPTSGRSNLPWIVLVVVIVALAVLAVVFRDKLFGPTTNEGKGVSKSLAFQAVFLTNGQVYFGKLSSADKDWVTLKDIYYLQVIQPPLQGQQPPGQQTQQQPQVSLVKLGNELHGPTDEMHIVRSQILFYEDLKEDGQVVKAIRDYKANPQGTTPAPVK